MATCRFINLFLKKSLVYSSKKSIMTTNSARAKKVLETLKDNPYFDKYAASIARLQQTNPDEFFSRIEAQEKKHKHGNTDGTKRQTTTESNPKSASAKPPLSPSAPRVSSAKLSDVMKLELLENKAFKYLRKQNNCLPLRFWKQQNSLWHDELKKPWINHLCSRQYGNYEPKPVYITTPIFYVNAGPHIGHLYTAALADALARYNKMLGNEVFFTTGTDEHGNKVRNAASKNNLSPEQYCEQISKLFREMSDNFDIKYDNFIRTTELKHQKVVQQFWTQLQNKGHIYLGKYSGWYCVSDEAFVSELELEEKKDASGNIIKVSATSGNIVEWMEEDNYKFRLSHFQDDLKHWLKDSTVVRPMKFHKMLLNWIEEGTCLEDLSISRPVSRAPWGLPVPNDSSHTIYVWLDALVNYLTSVDYPNDKFSKLWPPRIQVIGKDILKFHGIYWPAFLIAAGLDPPSTLLCHSHWTVCDEKMSKSKGNVISPNEAAEIFTADGLRYFLLREAVPHNDANYSNEKIRNILNTELANTLGNLVNRCMGKSVNPHGIIPEPKADDIDILNSDEAHELIQHLENLPTIAESAYNEYNLHRVVDSVMQTLFAANKMFECHQPWILAKEINTNEKAQMKLNAVISLGLEAARISSLILLPIVPRLISNLLDSLSVPSSARMWCNCKYLNTGRKSTDVFGLKRENALFFKRIKLNN
ncbi:hypothetical protein PV328_010157 [Microctonus aethiopoides]|uniref:Methionine--tRNA ligase, mitochondrial n=1 Tax=Microctonus aethiopoides TaxID=144406 RepID=A0AA39C876_9HYME|nr:hypothetical protein PV328_010157 [Microctonus aethiopoides]